jgi:hypothetical protein
MMIEFMKALLTGTTGMEEDHFVTKELKRLKLMRLDAKFQEENM